MRTSFFSTFVAVAVVIALPVVAHAHPGHDEPDFTWDFAHLAAHPWATLGCVGVLSAGAAIVWRLSRNRATRSS